MHTSMTSYLEALWRSWRKSVKFKAKVQVGGLQRLNVNFWGLNIYHERSSIIVKIVQTKELNLVDLWGLNMDEELSNEEETYVRSVSGSLQWASSSVRPEMAFCLRKVLGDLNREHKKRSLSDTNDSFARYNACGNLSLRIIPLRGRIDVDLWRQCPERSKQSEPSRIGAGI